MRPETLDHDHPDPLRPNGVEDGFTQEGEVSSVLPPEPKAPFMPRGASLAIVVSVAAATLSQVGPVTASGLHRIGSSPTKWLGLIAVSLGILGLWLGYRVIRKLKARLIGGGAMALSLSAIGMTIGWSTLGWILLGMAVLILVASILAEM